MPQATHLDGNLGYRDEAEALRARVDALEQSHAEVVAERDALKAELDSEPAEPGEPGEPDEARALEDVLAEAAETYEIPPTNWFAEAWEFVTFVALEAWPVTAIVTLTILGYILMAVAEADVRYPYELTWPATVTQVEGAPLEAGAACNVTVSLRTNRVASYDIDHLRVHCGSYDLYGWHAPIERRRSNDDDDGGPDKRCSAVELVRRADGNRIKLSCRDVGGRLGGRPEMRLDTTERGLAVWRDQPPFLKVQLEVDELSAPIEGPLPFTETPAHRVSLSTLFE